MRRDRQAFLHPGDDHDPRGVGDNARDAAK